MARRLEDLGFFRIKKEKVDNRLECKYGSDCYQKNDEHHKKYKHPRSDVSERSSKKMKVEEKYNCSDGPSNNSISSKSQVKSSECKESKSNATDELERVVNCEKELSPQQQSEFIKQKCLVEMPKDFYSFWEFCKNISKEKNPAESLRDIGLILVGPFDVLSGKIKNKQINKENAFLIHWRYYFDPPEFQTIIKGDDKIEYHIGYFRDEPNQLPCFVACNEGAKGCAIKPLAENIFGAVNSYIEAYIKTCDPFKKMKLKNIQTSVQTWANKNNFTLETTTPSMKARNRNVVAKTFHGAGIVVPWDKKTELGYRSLIETDGNIKNILKHLVGCKKEDRMAFLDKLEPIITAANIATDECDFGTGLELGMDLFSFGGEELHHSALHLLRTAYNLLNRKEFAIIAEEHLKNRRKGTRLSILDNQ